MSAAPLRTLARTTAGYSLSTLAGPLFSILLTPIYTRVLAVADYGTVDTLTMLGVVLYLLGAAGVAPALTALYFAPQHEHERPQVLASALWAGIGWSVALALLVAALAEPLARLALARDDVAGLVRLIALGLPLGVVSAIQGAALRLRFAVARSNTLALATLLASVVGNLLLVLALRLGAPGVIAATVLTNVAGGVAGLLLAPESLRARPRPDLMAQVLRSGAPLLPAGIASWALLYEDRLFLVRAVSLEQIGVYAVAVKLAGLLGLLIEPFKAAWGPLALSIREQVGAPQTYARVLTYYCAAGCGLALALTLFAHEALLVVTTPAYLGAASYAWMLTVAPLAGGLAAALAVGLYLEQRLAPLAWAVLAAALANTLLNILLIPRFGVPGAAAATAIGALVSPLVVAISAQRAHPIPFRWSGVAIPGALFLALAAAGALLGSRLDPPSLLGRAALLAAYLPLLRLLGVLDAPAIRALWTALRQPGSVIRALRRSP